MLDGKVSRASLILLLLIVAYPFVFIWQGLDVTDTGYYLVNCQQFFNAYPKDFGDAQCTAYWLTNLIGACWYKLTGDCGMIGFRLLYVIINYCILGLVYLVLRPLFGKQNNVRILLTLFVAQAFFIGVSIYVPSYNQVTAFFFIASAVMLHGGLVRRRGVLVFMAGLAAGISVFARIVNLPVVLLAGIAWYYHYITDVESDGRLWRALRCSAGEILRFLSGFATGIVLMLLTAAALGQLGVFGDMLVGLLQMGAGTKGTGAHGAVVLLKGFVWDYFYVGICSLGFAAMGVLIAFVAVRVSSPLYRLGWTILCGIAFTFVILKWPDLVTWTIPAMLYVICLAGAFGILKCNSELRLLCLLAVLVLFLLPLGSAAGIHLSLYVAYLAIPTGLMALMTSTADAGLHRIGLGRTEIGETSVGQPTEAGSSGLSSVTAKPRKFNWANCWVNANLDASALAFACVLCIVAFGFVQSASGAYRDSPDRFAMQTLVKHPKLHCIFTTASRARALEELLTELQPLVHKDGYLLDHMQVPLIYFLTETRPYLYSSWANVYDPPVLQQVLKKAISTRASLPVCLMTKIDTSHRKWPDETYPLLPYPRHVENRHIIRTFLREHEYQKHWENNAFEIWMPKMSN
jgi:hypothetical protein